ncbi:hypothetical protein [Haloglomus salinum]|uniref:hypothetical protein n=1 Tax=Haloglomus salinum TaxID=2962673 RepID=UPI0020C9D18C|nr:hypothetical protein [Haloglomus salinum]
MIRYLIEALFGDAVSPLVKAVNAFFEPAVRIQDTAPVGDPNIVSWAVAVGILGVILFGSWYSVYQTLRMANEVVDTYVPVRDFDFSPFYQQLVAAGTVLVAWVLLESYSPLVDTTRLVEDVHATLAIFFGAGGASTLNELVWGFLGNPRIEFALMLVLGGLAVVRALNVWLGVPHTFGTGVVLGVGTLGFISLWVSGTELFPLGPPLNFAFIVLTIVGTLSLFVAAVDKTARFVSYTTPVLNDAPDFRIGYVLFYAILLAGLLGATASPIGGLVLWGFLRIKWMPETGLRTTESSSTTESDAPSPSPELEIE